MANKYEMIVVLNPAKGEEALTTLTEDVLGNKRLAYEIADQKEGYYLQFNYSAESDFPKEVERYLKITDGVLRYLVIRIGE